MLGQRDPGNISAVCFQLHPVTGCRVQPKEQWKAQQPSDIINLLIGQCYLSRSLSLSWLLIASIGSLRHPIKPIALSTLYRNVDESQNLLESTFKGILLLHLNLAFCARKGSWCGRDQVFNLTPAVNWNPIWKVPEKEFLGICRSIGSNFSQAHKHDKELYKSKVKMVSNVGVEWTDWVKMRSNHVQTVSKVLHQL